MSQLVGKVLDSMPYEESYSLPYTLLISTLRKCETVIRIRIFGSIFPLVNLGKYCVMRGFCVPGRNRSEKELELERSGKN